MTQIRRVVIGLNARGRSYVASDGEVAARPEGLNLWSTTLEEPLGSDPGTLSLPLNPPSGGTYWRVVDIPPYEILREFLERGLPGHDEQGFHCTNTVDYVLVLEGTITLVLDEGSVLLNPGDCVVQRQTNHVWRNDGKSPVRIICVSVGIEPRQEVME